MTIKCDSCGQFMDSRAKGSSWVFVPDSDVSYEELGFRCPNCTSKYGVLQPNQSVVVELCSGVM